MKLKMLTVLLAAAVSCNANETPDQIDVRMEFVAFDVTNIAQLTSGSLSVASLTRLWTNGQGTLLSAPGLITQSGVQATVKGVTECIYPTEWTVSWSGSTNTANASTGTVAATTLTNALGPARAAVIPGHFETREVGSILTVLSGISPEGDAIELTLMFEFVQEPTWRQYTGSYEDAKGDQTAFQLEQPFFHTYSLNTTILLSSGAKMLVAGGMPGRDGAEMVYVFLTAHLIDHDGEAIKPHTPGTDL